MVFLFESLYDQQDSYNNDIMIQEHSTHAI